MTRFDRASNPSPSQRRADTLGVMVQTRVIILHSKIGYIFNVLLSIDKLVKKYYFAIRSIRADLFYFFSKEKKVLFDSEIEHLIYK